ncbi:hypothetical protein [Paraliomyxa miuraensis]|uniref:hypothetical protein n=1 Tax=Paraliomyxa miuraensis TaxID=376150 RepID=UPI00225A500B|nr:hypothetical protein [Paraliomyxa miuraensis]MCX4246382.1 hypothetical protein [Paraliomyxa miuraensis]
MLPWRALVGWVVIVVLPLVFAGCRLGPPNADDYVLVDTEGTSEAGGVAPSSGGSESGTTTAETQGSGSGSGDTGGEPVCGDGLVEGDEECDDGGESPGCNADCTAAVCGDALVNVAAGEQCDDGGETETCDLDCTFVACGDGVTNVATGEECDDGEETETCDGDCTFVACGDGWHNAIVGEECDDGGQSALCDVDCTLAWCGDGIFNASADEECDDAGRTAACDTDCTLVDCGDGYVNAAAGEQCDDMGKSVTCNSDCSVAWCGDGITNATAGEACDDAGPSLGCDADCTVVECGDLVINDVAGEECDDTDLAGASCAGEGFDDGALACDPVTCQLDTTGCFSCGDGVMNPPAEQCDGGDLGGQTCVSQGFLGGTLVCDGACGYDVSGCWNQPGVPVLMLGFSQVKRFDFSWAAVPGADYYQLEQSVAPGEPFVQLGGDVLGTAVSHEMPLHFRWQASYRLWACNAVGCTDSAVVDVVGSLAEAVGYFKASNTEASDSFGWSVTLSGDGNTLAIGAYWEDSNATNIGGNQADNSASISGAVYVFVRDGAGAWSQQAYVKASNTETADRFGTSVALSGDGNTLAVSAYGEDSNATGTAGNQADNSANSSGAVYIFVRDGAGVWSQQVYAKASNTGVDDRFGHSVALSGDGNTLAVGAYLEDSNVTGIGGNQANNSANGSGAVYIFVRDDAGVWSQQAYVKASNTGANDRFGWSVALSGDGNTLAVGTTLEDSNATGIAGNQADNSATDSGAVYVFGRDGAGVWSQQAYVKASNTEAHDYFGHDVALSGDGNTLAIGAYGEGSNATGIDGNQADDSASNSGAVYAFVRDGAGSWSQQAYVKASNTGASDWFGYDLALSGDGNTLAVGAYLEDSNTTGIGGNEADNTASASGAVYVFVRDGAGAWSQQTYAKASNTGPNDHLGHSMALTGDGNTLAVGAPLEGSSATGIAGNQADDSADESGAVYLY